MKRIRQKIEDDEEIQFQALEWLDSNEVIEDEGNEYLIRIFGVTSRGFSICVNVIGFTPYFYIKVPESWTSSTLNVFLTGLQKLVQNKNSLLRAKCRIQKKKEFFGFTGEKLQKFARLVFDNSQGMYQYKKILSRGVLISDVSSKIQTYKLYESNFEPLLRFIHIRNLQPAGWINVNEFYTSEIRASKCQLEINAQWTDIHPSSSKNNENAAILQASFDIETYSCPEEDPNTRKLYYPFPVPEKPGNVVYQIATCFKMLGSSDFLCKSLVSLKTCDSIVDENIHVQCFEKESDLLLAWAKLISESDPDILYSYNGDIFDCSYLCKRAEMLGIFSKFVKLLTRIPGLVDKMSYYPDNLYKYFCKESTFSSSAYGTSNYKRLIISGRINFDILIFIKREYKETSYKLDDISEKYLKEKKNDVSPIDIFKAYESGEPEQIKTIGLYCIQDTLLPQKLVDTLAILQTQISMSNVTLVPIKYLIEKGQQIKGFSQIIYRTRIAGYVIPVLEYNDIEGNEKFVGATVLAPDTGFYCLPVTVLDFASLYPSIIRAHNLCYSTIVLNEKYDNLPGVEYKTIEWDDTLDGIKQHHSYKFVQNVKSVLSELLAELALSRTKYKKLMEGEEDQFTKQIYNKTQLAYKVSMNSIYGILGAYTLKCKPIAATVTHCGRQMIKQSKEYIEKNYPGSKVVYGDTDSVFARFHTKSIQDLEDLKEELKLRKSNQSKQLQILKNQCMTEAFELGKEAAQAISRDLFHHPIKLEFEKVYLPLLMLSKKRYVGTYYGKSPLKPDFIDQKGVVLQRRDNCEIVKEVYKKIVDFLLQHEDRGIDMALEYLKSTLEKFLNGNVKINDLVITKTLRTGYKNLNVPHLALARKMEERDKGSAPKTNDRVRYVFIEGNSSKQYEKVEDPDYVVAHGLKIDVKYYIEKQLKNPISEVLALVTDDPKKIFDDILMKYNQKHEKESKINKQLESQRKLEMFIKAMKSP